MMGFVPLSAGRAGGLLALLLPREPTAGGCRLQAGGGPLQHQTCQHLPPPPGRCVVNAGGSGHAVHGTPVQPLAD